eukprot:1158672-Pelagomonas_calceolata.AAC.20
MHGMQTCFLVCLPSHRLTFINGTSAVAIATVMAKALRSKTTSLFSLLALPQAWHLQQQHLHSAQGCHGGWPGHGQRPTSRAALWGEGAPCDRAWPTRLKVDRSGA